MHDIINPLKLCAEVKYSEKNIVHCMKRVSDVHN